MTRLCRAQSGLITCLVRASPARAGWTGAASATVLPRRQLGALIHMELLVQAEELKVRDH